MSNPKKISIVIPVFNEADSLDQLYSEILNGLKIFPEREIIFIDDGSTDNSVSNIRAIIDKDPDVSLIQFYKNFGKADALQEGFSAATGDYVITMDADLQDDPAEIPNLISKLEEKWDMVSGWKKERHDPLSKRLPSKIFNFVTRLLFGMKIHDFNCGLKAYKSRVIKSIDLYGGLHRYIPAIARQKGFSVTEIVINHRPRIHGVTKYSGSRLIHGFFDVLTVLFLGRYLSRPLHFFGFIGLILTTAGLLINAYLTLGWFMGRWIGDRPIFFLGILLMIVGIQFFSLGLLGEMVIKTGRRNEKRIHHIYKKN